MYITHTHKHTHTHTHRKMTQWDQRFYSWGGLGVVTATPVQLGVNEDHG
jgi:hypothetical protein